MTTLMLVGSTGLVGRSVLQQALADRRIGRVVAPTRRALPADEKLENPIADFEQLPADAGWWTVDAVICTLGTTIAKAGSQAAFRRVDHDYIVTMAQRARARGATTFVLTSALGADASSRIFYNRVKGETEADVEACGFPSLTIVRPGLIGGSRDESRPAEFVFQKIVGALGPVLPSRYRINPAPRIAAALLAAAITGQPGRHLVSSDALV